jgi:hypothetical protein
LTVLEHTEKGIYVCVSEPGKNSRQPKAQSVMLMKRKDAGALLRARMTWREFAACPVISSTSGEIAGSYD